MKNVLKKNVTIVPVHAGVKLICNRCVKTVYCNISLFMALISNIDCQQECLELHTLPFRNRLKHELMLEGVQKAILRKNCGYLNYVRITV